MEKKNNTTTATQATGNATGNNMADTAMLFATHASEGQYFIEGIKPRFNLRQTKQDVPTLLYCVYTYGGRQWRVTTGLKVYPSEWNNATQQAVESNQLKKSHNRNNAVCNRRLADIKQRFAGCIERVADSGELDSLVGALKRELYPATARKKFEGVVIKGGLRRYVEGKNTDTMKQHQPMIYHLKEVNAAKESEGRKASGYTVVINVFARFVKEAGIADDMANLNLQTLNQYKGWLEEQGKRGELKIATIRNYEKALITLINDINEVDGRSGGDLIDVRAFKATKDTRTQKDKQAQSTPLTEADLTAIEKVIHLTPQQEEARDMFIAMVCSGQRVSDLKKVIQGDTFTEAGRGFVVVTQKKTKADAVVMVTSRLARIREKYAHGTEYITYDENGQRKIIAAIRQIAEIAGLDRLIKYTENGEEKAVPFYTLIHNHTARHTFSTLMSGCRVPDTIIALTTGHKLPSQRGMLSTYIHDEAREKARIIAEEYAANEKMRRCFIYAPTDGQHTSTTSKPTPATPTENNALIERIEEQAKVIEKERANTEFVKRTGMTREEWDKRRVEWIKEVIERGETDIDLLVADPLQWQRIEGGNPPADWQPSYTDEDIEELVMMKAEWEREHRR